MLMKQEEEEYTMSMQVAEAKREQQSDAMNRIDFDEETLLYLSLYEKSRMMAKNVKVALVTDNSDLQKLNYYLFKDVDDVDFYAIDENRGLDLSLIGEMDIVIYSREDAAFKEEILHHIRVNNLKTKFMVISDKPYLRQKDILQEHINGVDKLLRMDFFLEEYIVTVEKYLRNNFYSRRVLDLPDHSEIIVYEKGLFKKRINDLMKRKIYFSLFEYRFESEMSIDAYNLRKIVREHDTIYIDRDQKRIIFLLMNVTPTFGESIIRKRVNNFSITLSPEAKCNVFDLLYEEESPLSV